MKLDFNNLDRPYFIAEVGINHNGDIQIAKRLIDATYACQWDCVKFQKREPDIAVPEHQKNVIRDTPWGKMTYLEYKKRLEFGKKEFDYIDAYCREKPISWSSSVWDLPSLEFINQYDTPFIKIPSAQLTNFKLIEAACKIKKPLVISTGMSTLDEIDKAVEILQKNGAHFVLMHCHSTYPAPQQELNINCIKTLEIRYHCPVGYSGHEYDLEPTVYAAVLGAKVIERHITISHDFWGTDQAASLEVSGMDLLVKRIRNMKKILGNGQKKFHESEYLIRKKLRGT